MRGKNATLMIHDDGTGIASSFNATTKRQHRTTPPMERNTETSQFAASSIQPWVEETSTVRPASRYRKSSTWARRWYLCVSVCLYACVYMRVCVWCVRRQDGQDGQDGG